MDAAERCFSVVDDFSVTALVDFASAVCADVEAWFNSDGNEFSEAFEKVRA